MLVLWLSPYLAYRIATGQLFEAVQNRLGVRVGPDQAGGRLYVLQDPTRGAHRAAHRLLASGGDAGKGAAVGAAGGAAIGAATGGAVGATTDLVRADTRDEAGAETAFVLGAGQSAVIGDVSEDSTSAIDTRMRELGGIVYRRPWSDVRDDTWPTDAYLYPYDDYLYPYEYIPTGYR